MSESDKRRVQITVVLECDREMTPGFGYDPDDLVRAASAGALEKLVAYNPSVKMARWANIGRSLVYEVANIKGIDPSMSRRLVVLGLVEINLHKVTDPAAEVWPGDQVDVFSEGRSSCQTWRVIE